MKPTRRAFLFGGAAVGGGLVLGVAGLSAWVASHDRLGDQREVTAGDGKGPLVALWLHLALDGTVTVLSPHTEMGQGVHTGLLQIVADELDLPWEAARIVQAPVHDAFSNAQILFGFLREHREDTGTLRAVMEQLGYAVGGLAHVQMTGGSASIRFTGWKNMRMAAAAARVALEQAAANRWGVDQSTVEAELGYIVDKASGERLSYGELAEEAAKLPLMGDPPYKDPVKWRYIGKSMPRVDLEPKVRGESVYGIDAAMPGMVHAAVTRAPVVGAEITAVTNQDEITARKGVRSVHVLEGCAAVVADNPWRAEQALRALELETTKTDHDDLDMEGHYARMSRDLDGDLKIVNQSGDLEAGLAEGRVVEAEFRVPYLAHSPMEPLNALVHSEGDVLVATLGLQNPLVTRYTLAKELERDPETVRIVPRWMGGGFGRRSHGASPGDQHFLTIAAKLHEQLGVPVKVTLSREQDLRTCFMRPATVARVRAVARPDGGLLAYAQDSWGSLLVPNEEKPIYEVEHLRTRVVSGRSFVPVTYWRSVDKSIYPFFSESMVDEAAATVGVDPLAARKAMVEPGGREDRVLDAVARMSNWRTTVEEGRALGLAFAPSFGSLVAMVAEVSMDGDVPRVHTMYVAADLGKAINPDSVTAQLQGGVQFGLTAALYGQMSLKDGGFAQSNFHDYPMVRMADHAKVVVELLESDAWIGGAGEVGVPPVAPAIANAMAVLGKRPYRLPIVS